MIRPSELRALEIGVRRYLAGKISRRRLDLAFPDCTPEEIELALVFELLEQDSRPVPLEDRILH